MNYLGDEYQMKNKAPKNTKNAEIDLKKAPSDGDSKFVGVWLCECDGKVLETLTVTITHGYLRATVDNMSGRVEKGTHVKASGICLSFEIREGTENESEFGLNISEDGQTLTGSWTAVENGCGVRGSRTYVRKDGPSA